MNGRQNQYHLGRRGETLAADELIQLGYTIVDRNWRHTTGEVDIVARRGDTWTFFEVRTRCGCEFGTPEESLTMAKQRRMVEVAQAYLSEHALDDVDWRVGLVAVALDHRGQKERIEVYESLR